MEMHSITIGVCVLPTSRFQTQKKKYRVKEEINCAKTHRSSQQEWQNNTTKDNFSRHYNGNLKRHRDDYYNIVDIIRKGMLMLRKIVKEFFEPFMSV